MRRGVLSVLVWAGTVTGVGLAACGDSSEGPGSHEVAGEGGEGGAGAISGSGGSSAGESGGSDDGGRSGSGGSGAQGGSRAGGAGESSGGAGNPATGGSSAGAEAGGAGEGGAGGAGGAIDPDPVICDRFTEFEAANLADRIRLAFERTTNADCRLKWFLTLYLPPVDERALFGTNLMLMTQKLWGCFDERATEFQLIHRPVPLSPAEARALIDVYLAASRTEAGLSPSEVRVVEVQLEALAEPLIDPSLPDFSRSRCMGGAGGMAGSGGASGASGMAGLGGVAGTAGIGGAPGGEGGLGEGGMRAAFD